MLRGIRDKIKSLANDLKTAHERGYGVSFQLDNINGTVTILDIKQIVPIDLDADVQ